MAELRDEIVDGFRQLEFGGEADPVASMIVGAGASLLEALDSRKNSGAYEVASPYLTMRDYFVATKLPLTALSESVPIKTWRMGYMLNNAQFRIAAALDRLVNTIILDVYNNGAKEPLSSHHWATFLAWIAGRMTFAEPMIRATHPKASRQLGKAKSAIERYGDSALVAAMIEALASKHGTNISQIVEGISPFNSLNLQNINIGKGKTKRSIDVVEYFDLAITFGRVNIFKHVKEGTARNTSQKFDAEIYLCAKAFLQLVPIWNAWLKKES